MAGTDVIMREYMQKRSQMKSRLKTENYRYRWFELTSTSLRYCDGSQDSVPGKQKGQVGLSSITAVEKADPEPLGNRRCAFQIVYRTDDVRDSSTLYIMAPNEKKQNEWIDAIRRASVSCGANFTMKYHPGAWLNRHSKFSCCDSINKRSEGCQPVSWQGSIDVSSRRICDFGMPQTNSLSRPLPQPPCALTLQKQQQPSLVRVLALYNYNHLDASELDLVKGEEYEMLEELKDDANWCKAKNKIGQTGYIPTNFIKVVNSNSLEQYDWFYPDTQRTQSEDLLIDDGREGVFLVRESSQKDMYTLSVFTRASGTVGDRQALPHQAEYRGSLLPGRQASIPYHSRADLLPQAQLCRFNCTPSISTG
jgi:hypothetical protein